MGQRIAFQKEFYFRRRIAQFFQQQLFTLNLIFMTEKRHKVNIEKLHGNRTYFDPSRSMSC